MAKWIGYRVICQLCEGMFDSAEAAKRHERRLHSRAAEVAYDEMFFPEGEPRRGFQVMVVN